MLLDHKELANRLSSSNNLINRLADLKKQAEKHPAQLISYPDNGSVRTGASQLGKNKTQHNPNPNSKNVIDITTNKSDDNDDDVQPLIRPVQATRQVRSEDLIENLDDKISISNSKSRALGVISNLMARLENEVYDIPANKIASTARDIAQTIKYIDPEDKANKDDENLKPTFFVYAPVVREERTFDTIYAKEG